MILKWIATVVSVFSTIKVILFSISKVILLNIKILPPSLSAASYTYFTGLRGTREKMGKEKNTIRVILLSINKVILFNISKLIRKRQDLYVFLLFSIIRVILYSTNKVILSNTTKAILFGRIYKGIVVSPVVSPGFLIFSVLLP